MVLKHRQSFSLVLLVLLVVFVPLLQHGIVVHGQHSIGNQAFRRVWNEQDGPIADEVEQGRSWTWGPAPISPLLSEQMNESPGGRRVVQYFDKSRMEINDPNANPDDPWYVTNGLLPIEMMTGRIQVGYSEFIEVAPARVSAIGDPDTSPTYADLAPLYESPGSVAPPEIGQPVIRLLQPDGTTTALYDYRNDTATHVQEGENGHGVPQAFLDFQKTRGTVYRNGRAVYDQVYFPEFVFGLPVTKAYWVNSRVGGQDMPILFQVFERRVLTYNPANPPGFRVEMGNVGQHYYRWRYEENDFPQVIPEPGDNPVPATPVPTPIPLDQPDTAGFFGMNTYITGMERNEQDGQAGIARLVSLGREAGVEWAREEMSWANMEPAKKGNFTYGHYDQRVLQLAQSGYGIVGVLLTTPGWARVADCANRGGRIADYWCPPARAQDFADFVAATVERYDGDGIADAPGSPRIAVWQIWNEPSTRDTWPGSAAEYGHLLTASYQAAKAADPTAIVLTGGVYLYDGMGTDPNDGLPFLNKAIEAVPEAARSFDALAIHPYMPTAAPDAPIIFSTITLWGRITTAKNWLEQHRSGGATKPLWITEIGWSTCQPGEAGCTNDVAKSETEQANYLVRAHAIALAQGVQQVSYFQLEDKFDGESGTFWGQASVLGTGGDYRQKPSYQAYRVLKQQVGGLQFSGFGEHNTFAYDPTVENPQDLYHMQFTGGGGVRVDLLWRNAGSQQITFWPEPGTTAEWITRDGQRTPITGSSVTLTVSEEPLYVRQVP